MGAGKRPAFVQVFWSQAAAWRVRRQHLDQRAPAGSVLAVASRLCGLHAQVMSSAELALWARVEGVDRRPVRRALWEERTLVKTWAMRGTLHLLPADELPLWHAALGASHGYRSPALWRRFGITIEELNRLTETVATARQWLASLGEEVSAVELDGAPAWMLAADVREARELAPKRSVRLLPGFDPYVVGASCHAECLLPGCGSSLTRASNPS